MPFNNDMAIHEMLQRDGGYVERVEQLRSYLSNQCGRRDSLAKFARDFAVTMFSKEYMYWRKLGLEQ